MDGEATGTEQESTSSSSTKEPINLNLSEFKINEVLSHKTLEVKIVFQIKIASYVVYTCFYR